MRGFGENGITQTHTYRRNWVYNILISTVLSNRNMSFSNEQDQKAISVNQTKKQKTFSSGTYI